MCKVFDIRNKKQEEQYVDVLEQNAKQAEKTSIYGFDTFRFVGNIRRILPLIREKKEQVKACLKKLRLLDNDGPIELDADDIETECLPSA